MGKKCKKNINKLVRAFERINYIYGRAKDEEFVSPTLIKNFREDMQEWDALSSHAKKEIKHNLSIAEELIDKIAKSKTLEGEPLSIEKEREYWNSIQENIKDVFKRIRSRGGSWISKVCQREAFA